MIQRRSGGGQPGTRAVSIPRENWEGIGTWLSGRLETIIILMTRDLLAGVLALSHDSRDANALRGWTRRDWRKTKHIADLLKHQSLEIGMNLLVLG